MQQVVSVKKKKLFSLILPIVCDSGKYSSSGFCIDNCTTNQYRDEPNLACYPCSVNCTTCSGVADNNCTTCESPFALFEGECVDPCTIGKDLL